jgi:hypothetical protein
MSPSEFANEQLGLIRRTFFADTIDSQFYQERDLLLSAITYPAANLKERYGVTATDSLYKRVLKTVIETIVAKGNRTKIERFSVYFLHCVQQHMQHHGEEYYDLAKADRHAADSLPVVLGKITRGEAERTTEVLVELHRTLRGRRHKPKSERAQLTLI